jgi:thymidylate synthase
VTALTADSIDDLMRLTFESLILRGTSINPSRGPALELRGTRLELTNPRVRLSRSITRGKPFSALGELVWYLSGSDNADHIGFYVSAYEKEAETDRSIHAAYGTRLFGEAARLKAAIDTLLSKHDSRQAVVALLDSKDLRRTSGHIPCTSTLQFFLRDGLLDLVVAMRSNDAYLGLPHDVFAFTMLQEVVARSVGAELGTYIHFAGSLHLYDKHRTPAQAFLDEGLTIATPMPPIPTGDPWPPIAALIEAERTFRSGGTTELAHLNAYWADLARLLELFALDKNGVANSARIAYIRSQMHHDMYQVFLNDRFGVND